MAEARAAKARGVSMRRFQGWEPTYTSRTEDGVTTTTVTPEWDYTERNLAAAVDEIDNAKCDGCGGDLSVELTDNHPSTDTGEGHYHRFTDTWCRRCVATEKRLRVMSRDDEDVDGTPLDNFPRARKTYVERLPIPDEKASQK